MALKRITDLPVAGPLVGEELFEVSQLSTTVSISATTISAAAADNSYNDSGSGFVAAGFALGDRVRVQGFTGDTANNIFAAVVTAVTAAKMTIGGTDGDVIVDDAAGETVTITKWTSRRASVDTVLTKDLTVVDNVSNAQAITGGFAFDVIKWDTATLDPQGMYNTGTGVFTPTKAGVYMVIPRARLGAARSISMQIRKNGSLYKALGDGEFQHRAASGSVLIEMNGTTDYFEVQLQSDIADTLHAGATLTYCQVLGPM